MTHYPDCPKCENSNTSMSVVDVEIANVKLKGIQCNNCQEIIAYYKDYDHEFDELKEKLEDLESRIDD